MDADLRHAPSRSRLMREYLRRMALWSEKLGEFADGPFADLAREVSPYAVVEEERVIERVVEQLAERGAQIRAQALCRASLRWAGLRARKPAGSSLLPDPFEPMLMLFERGGGFNVENGVADFGFLCVSLRSWQENALASPIVELDDGVLDDLDAMAD
ncbi:hypothetical protein [Streptomyces zagrosensis]|uniref:Uncharacterized protein n=1 Tax=Streptomyces zagrosensis TaxID=1042984 RepID=A0A7W9Q5K4_9ACTN|nr:hypothetical protein [Streptomyces zagrosensis]MBB5933925.1 hypothetical protein [Streptomyces zagrosensis]